MPASLLAFSERHPIFRLPSAASHQRPGPFIPMPATLKRWPVPGASGNAGLEHRIGGLERDAITGHIS